MNKYRALKEKLKNRETVTMGNLILFKSPLLLDAFSSLDCVLIDKEHGLYDTESLVPLTMQCRNLGLVSIVRVEESSYHLIAKSIDLGADGIMMPKVESIEQIKTAVEAMHLPPVGRTGFGGFAILRDGETIDEFQSGRFFFPQIESHKGLELIPEIIEKYGEFIDGFIIGPNDYSVTLGIPRMLDDEKLVNEIKEVFTLCKKYGKSCGCFAHDRAHAEYYKSLGANIFWIGEDKSYIELGVKSLFEKL